MVCDIRDAFFMETSTHHPPKPVYKGLLLLHVALSLPLASIGRLQHLASSLSENPYAPVLQLHGGPSYVSNLSIKFLRVGQR